MKVFIMDITTVTIGCYIVIIFLIIRYRGIKTLQEQTARTVDSPLITYIIVITAIMVK